MKPLKLALLLFLLIITIIVQGQQIDFEKRIGKSNMDDWGYSITETFDNGYIIAGLTGAIGFGQEDISLIKTDQFGDTLWTKTFGTLSNGEFAKSVIQTADSGYAVLGYTESYGAGAADIYLIKTDINGDALWTKTYGGALNDDGYCLQETTDGGFIIAGDTRSFSSGISDVYLIKTNSIGDTLWTKTYGGISDDHGTCVQQTSDHGYIITGYTYSFGADFIDLYLFKVDSLGNIQWEKTYDGPEIGSNSGDYGTAVQETYDGGYIITGTRGYISATGFTGQTWLLKTDFIGDTLWTKTFGQINSDDSNGEDVKQCADSGFVVVASRNTFGAGLDVYIIRTDLNGDTLWTKTIDGGDTEKGLSININSDQSYIISGYAYELANRYQVYLIKISELILGTIEHFGKDSNQILIYPNPIKEFAYVKFSNTKRDVYFMKIYNQKGQLIREYITTDEKIRIEKKDLNAGIYLYSLINKYQITHTGKLIIE